MKKSLRCFMTAIATVGVMMSMSTGLAWADPTDTTIPTPAPVPPPAVHVDAPPVVQTPVPEPVQLPPVQPPVQAPVVQAPSQAPPATVVSQPSTPQPVPVQQAPAMTPEPHTSMPPVSTKVPPVQSSATPTPEVTVPVPSTTVPTLTPSQKPEESLPSLSSVAPSEPKASTVPPVQPTEPNQVTSELPSSTPVHVPTVSSETPKPSESNGVLPEPTTSTNPPSATKVAEPVKVDQPSVIKPQDGATVADAALVKEQPVEPKEASSQTLEEATAALQTLGSGNGDNRDNDRNRDRDHNQPPPPRDPDPHGWQCNDHRGPSWCQWNDWDYDNHGRPVFNNGYNFDLRVVYVDYNTGQRVEVIVRARSSQPINTPHSGDYSFLVFGVSAPNFAMNVGMGTFRSGNPCNNYCTPPPRPSLNFDLRINIWTGQTMHPTYVPVYDCGCGPYRRVGNRDYYRYYFGGTREVIGYWEGSPNQQGSNFIPVEQRETPAAPAYTPVTPANLGNLVGVERPGGDPSENLSLSPTVTSDSSQYGVWAVLAAAVIVVGGVIVGVIYYRRRA